MEEEVIKRTMPHSIEAERSVIGSMMMNSEAVAAAHEILTEDDFYGRQYGLLFKAMVEMYTSGVAVDLMTLKDKLDHMDAMPELSDINFLKELLDSVPTSANAKYYAGIVREKSVLRQLIKTSEHIANTCYSGKEELDEILDETEKKVFSIVQNRGESEYVSIDKVVLNAMERIETVSKIRGTVTGLPSGYTDLDYNTSGFQKSDLVIIAARPAMGKTAFELNIAEYMAFRKNATVAIFSLEMSKEQLVNRLLALESSVDSQKIRTGDVDDGDWEKLIEGANTIAKSHMIIDDTASISISELKSKCRRYKREFDLGIVIIDYLQLMTTTGRSESRQQEISEISRSLKSLARELNVPIIALSQLGRAVESRPDKRPMLSDLRESGAIEQDADMVMFLYRDDYYNKESEKKGIAEVIIAKQRNGPIGTIELAWIPKYTKFANLERKKE